MDIKVKTITIQLGKKELTLTLDEARQLRDGLNEAFPVNQPMPYYIWNMPYWGDNPQVTPISPWITWTTNDTVEMS